MKAMIDPQHKIRAAEGSPGGNVGGYPGRYPGGYPGGYPGSGGRMPQNTGQDIADNPKMQPLIHPSETLTVNLKNSEVDVTDDQFNKLILYTDGRQLPKPTDSTHQKVAAHWNGSQLVSDEKSPLGGKMSRTFELSQDGRKLYETLHIDNGRAKTPLVIRYVYDISNSHMQSGQDSDPDRPVLKRNSEDGDSSPQ